MGVKMLCCACVSFSHLAFDVVCLSMRRGYGRHVLSAVAFTCLQRLGTCPQGRFFESDVDAHLVCLACYPNMLSGMSLFG